MANREKYSMGTHVALLTAAIESVEKYHRLLEKAQNTAYRKDAENAAAIARSDMEANIEAAKTYGGDNG